MACSLPALLLVTALAAEPAGLPPEAMPRAPETRTDPVLLPARSFLVPLVEVPALNLAVWGFDRFVLRADFAKVNRETISENLRGGWEIDSDDLAMNFLGHPYHGSMAFNAARSSGLTFWEALPAPAVNSYLWEIAGEAEAPSVNDLVITSTSGALLGEAFHRLSAALWDGPRRPSTSASLLGAALNPLGAFNRRVFGVARPRPPLDALVPLELSLQGGGALSSGPLLDRPLAHAYFGLDLAYGLPWQAAPTVTAPLSVFRLQGAFGAPTPMLAALRLDGLVAGRSVETRALTGAVGLWGTQEFSTGPGFRVAGSGLGPGAWLTFPLGDDAALRAFGVAEASLLGAGGTFAQVDQLDREGSLGPAYGMGFGVTGRAELEWLAPSRGRLRAFASGLALLAGKQSYQTASLQFGGGGELELGRGHGLGAEVSAGQFQGRDTALSGLGVTGRAFYRYRFGQGLAAR